MSLVWEHYPAGGGELLTALAYADHAHDDGSGIRPSIPYMARKTRQSERTIQMHVGEMRRTGWLLVVSDASGGRGRTVEYRVNPGWIANPAEFAPFAKRQRVQSADEKGEIQRTKGCKAFAPQVVRTVGEPTTTTATADELAEDAVVVPDHQQFPDVFRADALASAMQVINGCPEASRQDVLDEIAGLSDRGAVRSPLGLLRRLVDAAKKGEFVPSAAIEYRRRLQKSGAEKQRRALDEQERQRQLAPDAIEKGRTRLAALRTQLRSRK